MGYLSSTTNAGNSATPSTAVPAGVASGTIILLACSIDNTAALFDPADWPTGFTELSEVGTTADGQRMAIGWKRATGADSGSYTFGNLGSSGDWVCQAVAFSGRHATNPPVVSTAATNNTLNATPVTVTANGVTAVAGDDLCWVSAPDTNAANNGAGHTPPTGYTERQDAMSGWANLSMATVDNVAAGATGTVSGTFALIGGSARAGWAAWLVRVPAASGADTTDTAQEGSSLAWSGVKATAVAVVVAAAATGTLTWSGVRAQSSTVTPTTDTARVGALTWSGPRAQSTAGAVHQARVGGMVWSGPAPILSIEDVSAGTGPAALAWAGVKAVSTAAAVHQSQEGALSWSGVRANSVAGAAVDTARVGATGWAGIRVVSVGDSTTPTGLGALSWSGVNAKSTAAAPVTELHIFTTEVPSTSAGDSQVTVGVEFTVDTDGTSPGGRFYVLSTEANGKTISMGLWNAAGTLLGTGSYTAAASEPPGWKVVNWASPVPLVTTETYTVGHNNTGYAYTAGGLAAAINNPPLHTPASGGRFTYGTLAKPTTSTDTNFFSDITYVAAAGGGTTDTAGTGGTTWSGVGATSVAGAVHQSQEGALSWSGVLASSAAAAVHQSQEGTLCWSGVNANSTTVPAITDTARLGALSWSGVRAQSVAGAAHAGRVGTLTWSGVQAQSAADVRNPARVGGLLWFGVPADSLANSTHGHRRRATAADATSTRRATTASAAGSRTAAVGAATMSRGATVTPTEG